ncbi:Acyl-CoA dehydrogenase [Cupriavidus sp. H19C3]|uniref:acyl-CoA dehydrogenase family protein n=1 Tax=Cupriavidus sp. H19C3 TaxID=3241603 RepID=UPI003BF9202A
MDTLADDPAGSLCLRDLIARYVPADGAPLPASGHTLARWRLLATVAHDHGAVAGKLFESHLDALAIIAEIAGVPPAPPAPHRAGASLASPAPAMGGATHATHGCWAVWAAEPPFAAVDATPLPDSEAAACASSRDALSATTGGRAHARLTPVRLNGRKAWCSGAREVTHALMTCRDAEGARRLAVVDMRAAGIAVTDEGWEAVGMRATHSGDVCFADTPALLLGDADAYLRRPGFWHGGAGIAACWYGAVLPFAEALHAGLRRRPDPHGAAHLGDIDGQLRAAAALLRETATWIDTHPVADAMPHAIRVRTVVEAAVQHTLRHAGNALGAGPLCRDRRLAACYADLPVFLRQSHAERDLAALGEALGAGTTEEWKL